MMTSALEIKNGAQLQAEVVVVGLGAGGGMAFHDLAMAGHDVLALELGGAYDPVEMNRREERMLPQLFLDGASRATEDMSIRILQGKGVGGSTLHNTNLCKPTPKLILEDWAQNHGLSWATSSELEQDFADVMRMLGVHEVPDARVNPNNRLLAKGLEALGWRGGRMMHNRMGCKQSGFCELGCPNNGKQNTAKVLVPPALELGARIHTNARVDKLLIRDGEVVGVEVAAIDPRTREAHRRFEVFSKRVILSASATNSAALALRSGVPDPHHLIGTNLHLHPGAYVGGLFEDKVESWRGVPQSVECTEFLSHDPAGGPRAWIVPGAAHPGAVAGLLPGFGVAHAADMRRYPHMASLIVMLHDESAGRVTPGPGAQVNVRYRLSPADWREMARGITGAAKLLLAAGAHQVVIPTTPARRVASIAELDARPVTASDLGRFSPPLVSVHPMSTMWMGDDVRRSVVDPNGQHHHVRGLYVADGSLFPTSIGGPPQISIYTLGRRVARAVMATL